VTIKGKLWKLQPNTVHVSFQKDLWLRIFSLCLHPY
jgi:hypothetical protein